MSFRFLEAKDLFAFLEELKTAQAPFPQGQSDLAVLATSGSTGPFHAYLSTQELLQVKTAENTVFSTLAFNPITLSGAVGDARVGSADDGNPWFQDSSDPSTQNENFGSSRVSGGVDQFSEFREWDAVGQSLGLLPSGWSGDLHLQEHDSITVGNPGHYDAGGRGEYWTFFQGLTDGIPGETASTGSNVYPAGLGLVKADFATLNASADRNNALVWVDLSTADVVGNLQNTPGLVTSDASQPFSEAPIATLTFGWNVFQFQPDPDSTAGAPKGELFMQSDGNLQIPGSVEPRAVFVKVIDFNPFNVAAQPGNPVRVHERVRLLNALEFDDDPMFGVSGANNAVDGVRAFRPGFHAPTQRFFLLLSSESSTPGTNAAGQTFVGYWARSVDPTDVTAPVARDVPRTNDIVEFEAFAVDNIASGVAGAVVDWSLVRNSTELEALTITGGIGTTSTVANGPIDTDSAGDEVLVVIADSTTLVEGVDYSVVASTGVITWLTDQSGATLVTATYEHRATDATPAHGTLLTQQSTSDEDGRVATQVQYPDDDGLVGTLDRLIATLA